PRLKEPIEPQVDDSQVVWFGHFLFGTAQDHPGLTEENGPLSVAGRVLRDVGECVDHPDDHGGHAAGRLTDLVAGPIHHPAVARIELDGSAMSPSSPTKPSF